MRQADASDGEHHLGRQLFITLELAGGDRVAHRLFDLALRGDADLLEEATQAAVKTVFVHDDLRSLAHDLDRKTGTHFSGSCDYGRTGLLSMYSPRLRCERSARASDLA